MAMNKIKIFSLSLLLGMSLASCEDILKENVNKDVAHSSAVDQQLPVIVFYAQQAVYDHAEYHVYLSQCLTTTGKSQTGSYPYKQGWEFLNINRHPQWRRHFYDLGVNINDLITNSRAIGSPNYELIGRAIRLMSAQLTTDVFGPMPLHPEAGGNAYESQTPRYEDQEMIYAWMLKEADDLIAMFENDEIVNNPKNKEITAVQDRIYAGDLTKWKGLVYAVKARLLLRNIPNVNTNSAMCQQIIDCAQNAINAWTQGDLMYGTWFGNEPRYKFDGGTTEQNAPWSVAQPKINSWESRDNLLTDAVPSKFFVKDILGVVNPGNELTEGQYTVKNANGYGTDPRISLLMRPNSGPKSASDATEVVKIRSLENNIGTGTSIKLAHYPNLYAGAYAGGVDAYNPLFTMEELYFIQAEAYYWMGNKKKACQLSKEATKNNIERHLERYLTDNGGAYPGNFATEVDKKTDAVKEQEKKQFLAAIESFLDNKAIREIRRITAKGDTLWTDVTWSVEEFGNEHYFFNEADYTLSDLMIQKWVSMYMQPEQWTDMRRYHYSNKRNNKTIVVNGADEIVYPTLRRPYNLYTPYWVDGLSEAEQENTWIQRLNYDPQTEDVYNMNEVIRVGAYKDYKWLQKKMIWAEEGRTSLTTK